MTEPELGRILREMYDNAPNKEKAVQVHLFGIKYAAELSKYGISKSEVVKYSGLSHNYVTEINKGVNLANYVTVKQ